MTREDKAGIAAEILLILPLFPIAWFLSVFYPSAMAMAVFVFGRAIIKKPVERWWHADDDMCLPTVYALFLGIGLLSVGLGAGFPLMFNGQPMLPVTLACIAYLWWDIQGDKRYKRKNQEKELTLDTITEEQLTKLCTMLEMSEVDTEISVLHICRKVTARKIYEDYNLHSLEATTKRLQRIKTKLKQNLYLLSEP